MTATLNVYSNVREYDTDVDVYGVVFEWAAFTAELTTRLTLVGASRQRLTIHGASAERLPATGTSRRRLPLTGSSDT